MRDVVAILEAASSVELDEREWARNLATTTLENAGITCFGAFVQLYDASNPEDVRFGLIVGAGVEQEMLDALFTRRVAPYWHAHPELTRNGLLGSVFCYSREIPGMEHHPALAQALRDFGIGEVLGINGRSPGGRGCMVCLLVHKPRPVAAATKQLFMRVAAHVAASQRLLDRLAGARVADAGLSSAVIAPAGRMLHAERVAKLKQARELLRDGALAVERARGVERRRDPLRAISRWRALVDQRWSLVDCFESDGKRYLVAARNSPDGLPLDLLTERERQVMGLALLGRANKEIGYAARHLDLDRRGAARAGHAPTGRTPEGRAFGSVLAPPRASHTLPMIPAWRRRGPLTVSPVFTAS